MSNGHKDVAVPGNVRTDLAKEIVNIYNRLRLPEPHTHQWRNW